MLSVLNVYSIQITFYGCPTWRVLKSLVASRKVAQYILLLLFFGKKTLCLRQNSYQKRPSLTYWLY